MANTGRIVGVLGGMGPEATVDFMAKVIELTPADKDQDHVHMLVDHNPQVPNRQAAILGDGRDPGPELARMAARIEAAGAEFLVMPCNTAHVFQQYIVDATNIPLISIIDASIAAVRDHAPVAKSIGILATDGCIKTEIFQNALTAAGLTPVVPGDAELGKAMELIGRIKAGDQGDDVIVSMRQLAAALVARGAEAIIAGCTEIPLILEDDDVSVLLISSTDVLAAQTVAFARGDIPLPG